MVIDLERIAPDTFPAELAIAAVTLAELAAGPHATRRPDRARPPSRAPAAGGATFEALPFDAAAARAYGRVYAEVAAGRKARGRRALDLLIAATVLAAELTLYTRNPSDFEDLGALIDVRAVQPAAS